MQLLTSILSFSNQKIVKHKQKKIEHDKQLSEYILKKQAMRLPLKISIYLELFQRMLDDQISNDGMKQISEVNAFKTFSYEEKVLFLLQNIECASQILGEASLQKQCKQFANLQLEVDKSHTSDIEQSMQLNIQTTAQINVSLVTKMGFGYWANVKFRLKLLKQQIHISGKQNCIIYLEKYFVRKSKNNKNTLVLQAISFDLPSRYKKVSLAFKPQIFQKVYNSLKDCMIKNQKIRLKTLFNQENFSKKYSDKNLLLDEGQQFEIKLEKGQFIFLTSYAIKSYFLEKQKIKTRLSKNFYDFKAIKTFNKQDSKTIDKRLRSLIIQKSNKRTDFYQSISQFAIPAQVLTFKFIDSFKQRNQFISQWQILEKADSGMQTLIQKYTIQDQQYNQLMIKEQGKCQQGQQLISLQCIGSLSQKVFLHFMIAFIQKINTEISILKIVVLINRKKKKGILHKLTYQGQSKIKPKSHNQVVIGFLKQFSGMLSKKQKKYQVTQIKEEDFFTVCEGVTGINEMKSLNLVKKVSSSTFLQQQIEQIEKKKQAFNNITQYQENRKNQSQGSIQSTDFDNNGLEKIEQFEQNGQVKMQQLNVSNQPKQSRIIQSFIKKTQQSQKIFSENKAAKQFFNQEQIFIKEHYLAQDWRRSSAGGLICINQSKISKQKEVLKKILTQLGENLLKQKNIMNISLPITIFKKQSQLTTVARNLSYAPLLFDIFYQQENIDSLQRMKYAIIFQISTNLASVNFQKPFNPILGQTMQVYINGCPFYLQQISHHPQISAYYFVGKGYKIFGCIQPKVSMSVNSCKAISDRHKQVVFDDGCAFQFGINILRVNGTVFGDRMFNFQDKTFVYDITNNILSLIHFGPKKKGLFQSPQQPLDYLFGKIWKMKKAFKQKYQRWKIKPTIPGDQLILQELSSFQGIWNKQICFDQQKYFDFESILPHKLIEQQNPLPSNSSFRQDLKLLIIDEVDLAQQMKIKMEDKQRRDKKLRDSMKKK